MGLRVLEGLDGIPMMLWCWRSRTHSCLCSWSDCSVQSMGWGVHLWAALVVTSGDDCGVTNSSEEQRLEPLLEESSFRVISEFRECFRTNLSHFATLFNWGEQGTGCELERLNRGWWLTAGAAQLTGLLSCCSVVIVSPDGFTLSGWMHWIDVICGPLVTGFPLERSDGGCSCGTSTLKDCWLEFCSFCGEHGDGCVHFWLTMAALDFSSKPLCS